MKITQKTNVHIDYRRLNTNERQTKAQLVEQEMFLVINSKVFKQGFIKKLAKRNYRNGETSQWRFASPGEILVHILRGAEILSPEVDYTLNIIVDDYYTFKRVIGMTYSNSPVINVNTKYFDVRSSKLCGSNIFHEEGHKLGFGHDFRQTARRADSICYLMNEVFEETWDALFGTPHETDKVLVCTRSWRSLWFKRCKWVRS